MAIKTEQELVTVTFLQSRSYDSLISRRQFRSAPIKDLIMKIKKTMKAPENYACFSLDNSKVVALDRVGEFVMM
ncbi:MAG: hypothetical protein QF526_05195 [Alphaproteobacteria bacterium]|nr:hypothetical protein [Alphaproteobacteria bacterium]